MPPTKAPIKKPAPAPSKPVASKPAAAPSKPATEKKDALATVSKNTALADTSFAGYDILQDAEQFQNEFNRSDYAMPFLNVLQSNSPQVVEGGPQFIDGARAGMFLLTASKEIFDGKDGITVVPAHYRKTFIEWKIRESGGGFVADHGYSDGLGLIQQCEKDDKNRFILPNGNQLVETAQYAVVIDHPEEPKQALFSLVSTQLKKSREWVSTIDSIRVEHNGKKLKPPMFYMSYTLTTVYESNDKGHWYGLVISPNAPVPELENGEALYTAARTLRESMESGVINTARSYEVNGEQGGAEDGETKAPF